MPEFSFTVELRDPRMPLAQLERATYEAGCDDALLTIVSGRILLDFDREAPSLEAAMASARRDLEEAGMTIMSVEPALG